MFIAISQKVLADTIDFGPIDYAEDGNSWIQPYLAGSSGVKVENYIVDFVDLYSAPDFESPGATNLIPADWTIGTQTASYMQLLDGTPADSENLRYRLNFTGNRFNQSFYLDTFVYTASNSLKFTSRFLWDRGTGNTFGWTLISKNNVPEPTTMVLLGSLASGLFGFVGIKKRFI